MSDNTQVLKNIEKSIASLKGKENKIYFFIQDTKGNPKGSVAYMYELCKILNDRGYNTVILHDDEYKGVGEWMGEEYKNLPHVNMKSNLPLSAHDFIIVPEILGFVFDQLANIPCVKIVLCQAYDYIFETLSPGSSWTDFGFDKCIVVTDTIKEYIHSFFPSVKLNTVNPFLIDSFKKYDKPQKPIVSIHTREQRDTLKIIKSFYAKYPQFRWISFKDLRSLPREDFAGALKESCLSVWVDDIASFGTFPLESMSCGVPVLGKVPNMIPEWMTEDNGLWEHDFNKIIDRISNYIKVWLEDGIPDSLYNHMSDTVKKYSKEQTESQLLNVIEYYTLKRIEALEEAITKIKIEAE